MNDKTQSIFPRFIREPLADFMVLGGVGLFVLYANVNEIAGESPRGIVVDETDILRLAEQFQRTWMRPPTRQELEGLAADFVKEEILYREAVALLGRDSAARDRRRR